MGSSNKKITLLMVGLDNAGKTCTAKTIVGEVRNEDIVIWTRYKRALEVCQLIRKYLIK